MPFLSRKLWPFLSLRSYWCWGEDAWISTFFSFLIHSFFFYVLKENVVGVLSRSVWKFFSFSPGGIPSKLFGKQREKGLVLATTFCMPGANQRPIHASWWLARCSDWLHTPPQYIHDTQHHADYRTSRYGHRFVFVALDFSFKFSQRRLLSFMYSLSPLLSEFCSTAQLPMLCPLMSVSFIQGLTTAAPQ
jgi:hypothetical protein